MLKNKPSSFRQLVTLITFLLCSFTANAVKITYDFRGLWMGGGAISGVFTLDTLTLTYTDVSLLSVPGVSDSGPFGTFYSQSDLLNQNAGSTNRMMFWEAGATGSIGDAVVRFSYIPASPDLKQLYITDGFEGTCQKI